MDELQDVKEKTYLDYQADGFKINSVGIQFLSDEENMAKAILVCITFYSKDEFHNFTDVISDKLTEHLEDSIETKVTRARVYVVWVKDVSYGTNTGVSELYTEEDHIAEHAINQLCFAEWQK